MLSYYIALKTARKRVRLRYVGQLKRHFNTTNWEPTWALSRNVPFLLLLLPQGAAPWKMSKPLMGLPNVVVTIPGDAGINEYSDWGALGSDKQLALNMWGYTASG